MEYRAVLFDFDFTLADASEAIVAGFQHAFRRMERPVPDPDTVRRTIGLVLEDAYTQLSGDAGAEGRARFRSFFTEVAVPMQISSTRFFPGAVELLEALRDAGIPAAIVSTKRACTLREVLDARNLLPLFASITGGEDVSQPKPHPEGLLRTVERLGLTPDQYPLLRRYRHRRGGRPAGGRALLRCPQRHHSRRGLRPLPQRLHRPRPHRPAPVAETVSPKSGTQTLGPGLFYAPADRVTTIIHISSFCRGHIHRFLYKLFTAPCRTSLHKIRYTDNVLKKDNKTLDRSEWRSTNMNKLFSLALTGALSLGLLAGCSSGSSAPSSAPTAGGNSAAPTAEQTASLSGAVNLDGSTSMEKVVGVLGEAFSEMYPDVTINYSGTGSSAGITAALEGTADIGLASRDLKDSETGVNAVTVAKDGIAIIVNPENPVSDLSIEQISQLFTGEVTNWSELDGADGTVVPIGREAGSGTRDGFESITDTKDACKYTNELTSTGEVIASVASNPNAIGYASLSAVDDTVKAVTVGGVEATEATVLDGTYAIQRNFNFILNSDKTLSDAAQAFLDFATSADASDLITGAGAVPLA